MTAQIAAMTEQAKREGEAIRELKDGIFIELNLLAWTLHCHRFGSNSRRLEGSTRTTGLKTYDR